MTEKKGGVISSEVAQIKRGEGGVKRYQHGREIEKSEGPLSEGYQGKGRNGRENRGGEGREGGRDEG